jgi:hypothetical protein
MPHRAIVFLAVLLASAALEAKGPTVKLTLTGPGLARPVEITDPVLLQQSQVWAGSFIGDTVATAPNVAGPAFQVTFDVKLPEWQRRGVRTMYTVTVARDARTGALWLYLPGRGEPGYAMNVGTMLRENQDGRWHRPSTAWAIALAKHLPARLS